MVWLQQTSLSVGATWTVPMEPLLSRMAFRETTAPVLEMVAKEEMATDQEMDPVATVAAAAPAAAMAGPAATAVALDLAVMEATEAQLVVTEALAEMVVVTAAMVAPVVTVVLTAATAVMEAAVGTGAPAPRAALAVMAAMLGRAAEMVEPEGPVEAVEP